MKTKSKQRVPTQNEPVRRKATNSATWKLRVPNDGCPNSVRALAVSKCRITDRSRETDSQNATISTTRTLPSILFGGYLTEVFWRGYLNEVFWGGYLTEVFWGLPN